MINHIIDILIEDGATGAITTNSRIFPLARLQGSAVPAVVVQLTNTTPVDTHDGVATVDEHTVQVTAIAETPKACYDLGEVVRLALDGYTGGDISSLRFVTQATDIFEADDLFTITMQFEVALNRSEVSVPTSAAVGNDLEIRGALYYQVRDIELEHNTTYTVGTADYCIFANYAEARDTKTATLRLPSVAVNEGRVLRVKTGSNLSNQRTLVLEPNPNDGSTIDGAASATMDRDYDGITLLCHLGEWYVVQRKSK